MRVWWERCVDRIGVCSEIFSMSDVVDTMWEKKTITKMSPDSSLRGFFFCVLVCLFVC